MLSLCPNRLKRLQCISLRNESKIGFLLFILFCIIKLGYYFDFNIIEIFFEAFEQLSQNIRLNEDLAHNTDD
jgi:hypothetical protein